MGDGRRGRGRGEDRGGGEEMEEGRKGGGKEEEEGWGRDGESREEGRGCEGRRWEGEGWGREGVDRGEEREERGGERSGREREEDTGHRTQRDSLRRSGLWGPLQRPFLKKETGHRIRSHLRGSWSASRATLLY